MNYHKTYYYLLIIALCFTSNLLHAQQPTDCINAITVCGNSEINLDVNGVGTQELFGLNNCSSQENNSLWLKVTLVTDGTLGFTLTPESNSIVEDYDFFVFGPNQDCNNLNQAIRCSTTNPQGANQGNNLTGMNETETDSSEGPGAQGNSFVRWLDVTAGETYFIVIDRPIGNSPFNLEWTGTAQFASPPTNESSSSTATNLDICDSIAPFDDESTLFDLTINTPIIVGSQTNVTVSYFESESDANINNNEIIGAYNNISNPQEVYAKITDDITGCFEIIPFELLVNSGPNFTQPTDLKACDNSDDGNDNNGQTIFDLSEATTEILSGQNASDYNITYYTSQINAENDVDELPLMYYNSDAGTQTVFVRIENISNLNCFNIAQFNLIVQPTPASFNAQQTQCSDTNASIFNLTHSNNDLTGGLTNLDTTFFNSLSDATNSNNEITNSTEYTNSTNPETIYVQVIDSNTSCFSIAELTLRISNTSATNSQITVCDDDGEEDGIYVFDLSEAESAVLTGVPGTPTIAYYESLNNALLEIDSLNTTYTNTSPFTQIIYARVENNDDCYGIAEIVLTVNSLPDIETEDFKYYCLNTYPDTLTLNSDISDTNNYTFFWSTGETTPTIEINEIANYTVEITSNNTTCSNIRTITVEPSNIATVESIEIIDASDNNTVTVIVSGEGEYEYALFNEYGSYTPFQSSNIFNNVLGGIYSVQIRDIKNGCGIVEANLTVIGFPKFFTPNGDGDNDVWHVKGLTALSQPNAVIYIFNRYGKLMKELLPTSAGWDGTFNGNPLPTGGYWFSVKLQDGSTYQDHFTLKR